MRQTGLSSGSLVEYMFSPSLAVYESGTAACIRPTSMKLIVTVFIETWLLILQKYT